MRTRHMRHALIALIALFGVASAANADHRRDRYDRDYRGERLQVLAHELERRAERLYVLAERQAHHNDHAEARALDRLYEFKREARHFHREVEKFRRDPYHVDSDFRELHRAYVRALGAVDRLHAYREVRREADRVSDVMFELRGEMAYFRAGTRHGRYGVRYDGPRWSVGWSWSTRR